MSMDWALKELYKSDLIEHILGSINIMSSIDIIDKIQENGLRREVVRAYFYAFIQPDSYRLECTLKDIKNRRPVGSFKESSIP